MLKVAHKLKELSAWFLKRSISLKKNLQIRIWKISGYLLDMR
jgi:hypothetical protein